MPNAVSIPRTLGKMKAPWVNQVARRGPVLRLRQGEVELHQRERTECYVEALIRCLWNFEDP
jgi:hypothetical protein